MTSVFNLQYTGKYLYRQCLDLCMIVRLPLIFRWWIEKKNSFLYSSICSKKLCCGGVLFHVM